MEEEDNETLREMIQSWKDEGWEWPPKPLEGVPRYVTTGEPIPLSVIKKAQNKKDTD